MWANTKGYVCVCVVCMPVCVNIMKALSGSGHRCMAEAEAEAEPELQSKVKRTDSAFWILCCRHVSLCSPAGIKICGPK